MNYIAILLSFCRRPVSFLLERMKSSALDSARGREWVQMKACASSPLPVYLSSVERKVSLIWAWLHWFDHGGLVCSSASPFIQTEGLVRSHDTYKPIKSVPKTWHLHSIPLICLKWKLRLHYEARRQGFFSDKVNELPSNTWCNKTNNEWNRSNISTLITIPMLNNSIQLCIYSKSHVTRHESRVQSHYRISCVISRGFFNSAESEATSPTVSQKHSTSHKLT